MKLIWNNDFLHRLFLLLVILLVLLLYQANCKTYVELTEEWENQGIGYNNPNSTSKLEKCLFKKVDEQEGEYLALICKERLDNSDLETAWQLVNGKTTEFKPKDLLIFCELCICIKYQHIPQNLSTVQIDASRSQAKTMNYTEVFQIACTMPRFIDSDLLAPFHNVETLNLFYTDVQKLDLTKTNGSPLLPNVKFFNIMDTLNLTKDSFGPFGLCQQLPNLTLMFVRNSLPDYFPKVWFVPENHGNISTYIIQAQCESLQVLVINRNNLYELENHIFDFAINLQSLDLTGNQIHVIHGGAFQGLNNLESLKLSNNSIEVIKEFLFEPLQSITLINLDRNNLHIFNTSTLQQLTRLRKLDISQNEITDIKGIFPPLATLDVSYNNLHQIEHSYFINCSGLTQLYMSHNKITFIENGSFQFLHRLYILDLSKNLLQDAESLHGNIQNLTYLSHLNISHNGYTTLVPKMFQILPITNRNYSSLSVLDISSNSIHTISPDAFDHLGVLISLRIGNNPLLRVPTAFDQLRGPFYLDMTNTGLSEFQLRGVIRSLDLSRNKLRGIPVSNGTNIVTILCLNHNHITKLSEFDFLNYNTLSQLDLSWNHLSQIHPRTFMVSPIAMLDLSHNELNDNSSTDSVWLPRNLVQINLAHNLLQFNDGFKFSLTFYKDMLSLKVDMSYNPIKSPRYMSMRIPAATFILQSCNMSSVTINEFKPWNFNTLDLKHNEIKEFRPITMEQENTYYKVDIRGNVIKCSCNMRWLKDMEYRRHYEVDYCEDVITHKTLPFYDVPDDRFLCKMGMGPNCPIDEQICTCYTNDTNTGITNLVDCSNRNLTQIPLSLPTTAKTLQLGGNNFHTLDAQTFDSLTKHETMETVVLHLDSSRIVLLDGETFIRMLNLEELHLEHNKIQYLHKGTFSHLYRLTALFLNSNKIMQIEEGTLETIVNLEVLNLANNMLQYLDQSMLNEIGSLRHVRKVSLGNNSWTCECDNLTFKDWLQDHDHIIADLTSITCNDTAIVNIPDDDLLCYDDIEFQVVTKHKVNWTTVAVTSTIAAIATCLFIAGIITYRKRFMCKVLLYNYFNFRLNVKENPHCQYDAFVVYDNNTVEVRNWIRTELLEKLEPTFKLCIPDRNILPGTIWADVLSDAIHTSRRTILVLSVSGMEDEHILYAFQVAYHRSKLKDATHRIFCILLPDADEKALIDSELTDPHVKAMLRAGQGFHVDDKMFWEKVMFCMPKPQLQPNDEDNIPMYYIG